MQKNVPAAHADACGCGDVLLCFDVIADAAFRVDLRI